MILAIMDECKFHVVHVEMETNFTIDGTKWHRTRFTLVLEPGDPVDKATELGNILLTEWKGNNTIRLVDDDGNELWRGP